MTTRGYEIALGWDDSGTLLGKPFKYGFHATLADYYSIIDKYNNALKSLSNNAYQGSTYYEGMRLGDLWGYVCNGLYQTQAEIDADEAMARAAGQEHYNPLMQQTELYNVLPGQMRFEDLDGDGYISRGKNTADEPGDRKIIGNSEPRYIYSFGIDLEWAGIFANAFFQGVGKQDWYPDNESSAFWGESRCLPPAVHRLFRAFLQGPRQCQYALPAGCILHPSQERPARLQLPFEADPPGRIRKGFAFCGRGEPLGLVARVQVDPRRGRHGQYLWC